MTSDSIPNLYAQIGQLVGQIKKRVGQLRDEDPIRGWFELELNQISERRRVRSLSLEDANAQLHALKQLSHLLFEHCVKIQNPDFADAVNIPDSFLTIQARMPANVLDTAKKYNFSIDPRLLHDHNRDNDQFDPVSPTAKIVGYLRGLDPSLALASDILAGNEGESLLNDLGIECEETRKLMAILFQSRYHAINAAVANADHDNNQVIEFAAGISPRGFQWSQTSPGTIYVESDLPQLMIHKSKLIRNALIRRDAPGRGILHCCAADVLDRNSMLDAIKNFDCQQPITFVTEGLLLYFNPLEMQQFWDNMKLLLTEHPNSVWITDLVTKKNLVDSLDAHVGVAQAVRSVFQLTSRNVVADNPFEDDSSVEKHLKGFGLSLKSSLQMREALSLLPIDDPETLALAVQLVGNRRIWRISA